MAETSPPALTDTHTRLLVDEYAACLRFYRDALGFEVTFGDEDSGYADLRTGGTTVALFDGGEMARAVGTGEMASATPGRDHRDDVALVFSVDDVDDVFERLSTDAEFVTEPHDRPEWGIRVAHFRDPSGTLVEINEHLEGT